MASFWWLWVILAGGFFLLYVRERRLKIAMRKKLTYINKKMEELTKKRTPLTLQRLLVVTGDTELQELLRAINSLLDQAHQLDSEYARMEQAMRRMLSNVSHDLKTPLTVIMGYGEVLSRDVSLTQDEQRRMLTQIYKKTTQVQELIQDFFDLSKLEAGDYSMPLSVIDAAEVCRQRILNYFDLLSAEDIKVNIHLPEEPGWVYANEEALSRILDNLLSNAMRYGADGGYLGLSLKHEREHIKIAVIDQGQGIKEADQAKIFERTYTMDDSRNSNIRGNGLGLTIVKRLTEQMGGNINLVSIPNQRTCFTVTLPSSKFEFPQNEIDKLRKK